MLRERIRPTLFGIGLAVVTVALVGAGIAAPATAATSPATAVAKILADTNALRAANGKPPLVENPAIDQVAQAWAAQMGAAGAMSHNPNYAAQMPAGWSQVAENVATGYAYDRVVPDGWAKSAGHLANILGDNTDIGIGYWESPTGVTYFVQDFGKYPSSTSTPTATPSPSATSTPSPAPTSTVSQSTSMPNLPTIPWSGGPAYYAQFPVAKAGGWTDPSFFPIGVWYGKPGHAATLASLGINTYVNAEHDGSPISMITNQGISVIAGDEWTPAEVKGNNKVVGWQVSDECEMAMGPCATGGEAGALATQKSLVAPFRAYNDGRFLQANFSNGALGTWWAPNTMGQHVGLMDVTSVDKYAYTNPEADYVISQAPTWPKGKDPNSSAAYGWLQDRMETYSSKPNWVIIETAKPYLDDPNARTIQPNQIEGAVWNAIIHGATGITYFQHNNNGCGNYSIVECGATLQNKIKSIDAQVKSLAPVINTQSYVWNFGSGLDTSLKVVGGYAYIFAMSDGTAGTKTFTLPAGLSDSVQVVDENRTITASGGIFSDSFAAEYSHHIYKVALTGAPPSNGNQTPPPGGGTSSGSTPVLSVPSGNPFGAFDAVAVTGPGSVSLSGWAIDPDTASSIPVHVYVDGAFNRQLTADNSRPDVGAAFSGYGASHGWSSSLALSGGAHSVCVYALNSGPGNANPALGCRTVNVPSGNPFGAFDAVAVTGPGSVSLSGWAIDPDTASSIPVHVYVDGAFNRQLTADNSRPDVGAAFSGYGASHGWSSSLALSGGAHSVCVYALNSGPGNANPALGCRTVNVPSGNPFGAFDAVAVTGPGSVSLSGWAIDPDTASSIPVHVYVDGAFNRQLTADNSRPDVGAAFSGYGASHGWSSSLALSGGAHSVCVYALNSGPGNANPALGCRTVNVPSGNPFGAFDAVAVTGPGSVSLSGWAIDPDTASSIPVHVYVDGAFNRQLTADNSRPDVGAAFSGYGASHGWSSSLALSGGAHSVCVYALNSGPGNANPALGCRTVNVPSR